MCEHIGDSHSDDRKAQLKSIEITIENKGVPYIYEASDLYVFILGRQEGTLMMAMAPRLL